MPFKIGHEGYKSWLGKKHTDITKKKMSISRMRNQPMNNPETVEKRSKTLISNKTFAGEKNPRWKGGSKSYRGYGWAAVKKERRLIDNYTCQDCGKKETFGKRAFDVHHVIDFKNGGTNEMNNLLTLCRSCHNKKRYAKD